MLQVKVGIQLASLKQPFKKALHTAAALGANGVEIDGRNQVHVEELSRTGVRHLKKTLEDYNLKCCAVGFRTRNGYNVSDGLERRMDATKAAMKMAFELGASVVVNHIGRIPSDEDDPQFSLLVESLTDLGQFSQKSGAWLVAETGGEDAEDLKRLIEALPDYSIGVNFDPGNLIMNGFSASTAIQTLAPYVRHVHAKDGTRDLAQGRGVEVPLGRGSVDFSEILARLEEQQYNGYFTVEREGARDPVVEVANAVQFMRSFD